MWIPEILPSLMPLLLLSLLPVLLLVSFLAPSSGLLSIFFPWWERYEYGRVVLYLVQLMVFQGRIGILPLCVVVNCTERDFRTTIATGELVRRNSSAPRIIPVNDTNNKRTGVRNCGRNGCLRFRRVFSYVFMKNNEYPAVSNDGFVLGTFWSLCSSTRCFF